MVHVDIVLHHSVFRLEIHGVISRVSVATSEPKHPCPTHNRSLSDRVLDRFAPKHTETAAFVFAMGEHEGGRHEERHLALRRRGVDPLRSPHRRRAQLRAFSQRVVHRHHHPERRRRGIGRWRIRHHHHRRLRSGVDVVEVEVQVG